MANYMMEIRQGVPEANKLRSDAKQAFEKSIKDEETIEKKVKDWTAKNRKWLRQRKKDKSKEKGEPVKTTENNIGKANWLMNFARDLKPDKNLKKLWGSHGNEAVEAVYDQIHQLHSQGL